MEVKPHLKNERRFRNLLARIEDLERELALEKARVDVLGAAVRDIAVALAELAGGE